MPAKKAKKKKTPKPKHPRPCSKPNLCKYSQEVSDYMDQELWRMIRELRRAVCNLESVVLDMKPSDNSRRICTGGGGDEPADPPKPPLW